MVSIWSKSEIHWSWQWRELFRSTDCQNQKGKANYLRHLAESPTDRKRPQIFPWRTYVEDFLNRFSLLSTHSFLLLSFYPPFPLVLKLNSESLQASRQSSCSIPQSIGFHSLLLLLLFMLLLSLLYLSSSTPIPLVLYTYFFFKKKGNIPNDKRSKNLFRLPLNLHFLWVIRSRLPIHLHHL